MTEYQVSVLFDLHDTLVDGVYRHAAACQQAVHAAGIEPSAGRIHRRIGTLCGKCCCVRVWNCSRAVTVRMSTWESIDEQEVRVAALRG